MSHSGSWKRLPFAKVDGLFFWDFAGLFSLSRNINICDAFLCSDKTVYLIQACLINF